MKTTDEIVESLGGWWVAVIRSFGVMSASIYPTMTSERRMAGEPQYRGDEGSADAQESLYREQDEWRLAGGSRIISSDILKKAERITDKSWPVMVLAMHDNEIERDKACYLLSKRISRASGSTLAHSGAVCKRWGEERFRARHTGAVSREYRIKLTHTVAELIKASGVGERTEIKRRSEIYLILNDDYERGKERLENA